MYTSRVITNPSLCAGESKPANIKANEFIVVSEAVESFLNKGVPGSVLGDDMASASIQSEEYGSTYRGFDSIMQREDDNSDICTSFKLPGRLVVALNNSEYVLLYIPSSDRANLNTEADSMLERHDSALCHLSFDHDVIDDMQAGLNCSEVEKIDATSSLASSNIPSVSAGVIDIDVSSEISKELSRRYTKYGTKVRHQTE